MRATVIDGPGVWMESAGSEQLARVASHPSCVCAVGMPDLHPGRGVPIGAVFAMREAVHPDLVGGDAGCGARITFTTLTRLDGDRAERRLREAFARQLWENVDPHALRDAVWSRGVKGLCDLEGVPEDLQRLAGRVPESDTLAPSGPSPVWFEGTEHALGTIGGGNHFAEIGRVRTVLRDDLGVAKNSFAVLVHSGSRGLGTMFASRWRGRTLATADASMYMAELAGACRFARANRVVLTYRILSAIGGLREASFANGFDVTHNDVRVEEVLGAPAWVHRKGAAPAYANVPTVVLGSRGTPSWIMIGAGNEVGLRSVAHGAGRKMGRGEAREKIKARYLRTQLARSCGGRVICDDPHLLLEEHPDAYKSIEPVVAALETHGLAARVLSLEPVVTVKL